MKTKLLGILLTLVVLSAPAFIGVYFGVPFFKGYFEVILGALLLSLVSAVTQAINNQLK